VPKEIFKKNKILEDFKGDIKFNEPLYQHTSFGIGGPCSAWVSPASLDELKKILVLCKEEEIKSFVIGRGSNLLVGDKGYEGIVISLDNEVFRYVKFFDLEVCAGCGIYLRRLLELLTEAGLCGLEFLTGIPATLGGAVFMNAGGNFGSIGDAIEQVKVIDYDGNIKFIDKNALRFGYRCSNLDGFIILEAKLTLKKDSNDKIARRMKHFLEEKHISQDLKNLSAGCIFKNPKDSQKSAGKLIELSGLKGEKIGGAQVSNTHANFIVYAGNAKASDVLELIGLIQKKVKSIHGIWLEPEVRVVK